MGVGTSKGDVDIGVLQTSMQEQLMPMVPMPTLSSQQAKAEVKDMALPTKPSLVQIPWQKKNNYSKHEVGLGLGIGIGSQTDSALEQDHCTSKGWEPTMSTCFPLIYTHHCP